MKVADKYIIGCLATIIIVSVVTFFAVSAQNPALTDQQIEQISGNCLSTKNTLTQLHASDALLRVNRGQIYESMYTKLMERFNARATANKLDSDDLSDVAQQYNLTLDAFRLDYQVYEEQLAKTLDIDCTKQPTQFYDSVILARSKRDQVHTEVLKLNQYIDQYQLALDQFEQTYNQSDGDSR